MATGTLEERPKYFPPFHRITVAKYHHMINAGVLTDDDSVELLEGYLVEMMAKTPAHDYSIQALQEELGPLFGPKWVIRVQLALTTKDSEPQPDVAVATGPRQKYKTKHPGPLDVALIIEVALTSLQEDRFLKSRIYARGRVPVYWIVNLQDMQIEVYTNPKGGKFPHYADEAVYQIGQSIPLILDGREFASVPVKDLLP